MNVSHPSLGFDLIFCQARLRIRRTMPIQIDDAFIREWNPKYSQADEGDYEQLVATVAAEMSSRGTISKETFLAIWNWKGARRVIRHVVLGEYDTRYAEAFRRAASEPPARKLNALLESGVKLPGVGAPTGSTVVHFIDPSMPIIDVRTVETLFESGLISTKQRDLGHYEEYRQAIEGIRRRCPGWSVRQIDRALFAYHKQVLDKKASEGKLQRSVPRGRAYCLRANCEGQPLEGEQNECLCG
jgi:hypothetical protein